MSRQKEGIFEQRGVFLYNLAARNGHFWFLPSALHQRIYIIYFLKLKVQDH